MELSNNDSATVESTLEDLHIHVRVREQLGDSLDDAREKLLAAIPKIFPFDENHYDSGWAVLDWDHRLPSNLFALRLYFSYSQDRTKRIGAQRHNREKGIEAHDLYPEFDVPDFADLVADESYIAVVDPEELKILNWQFASPWRKESPGGLCDEAIDAVQQTAAYQEAEKERGDGQLGTLSFVGWLPPCIAKSEAWALEFWLVMRFDGSSGEVQVFVVDSETLELTRSYRAEVQAS